MVQMVAAGEGCTVLPYSAVHAALVAGQVCAAPVADLRITWAIAHSRERTLSRPGASCRACCARWRTRPSSAATGSALRLP